MYPYAANVMPTTSVATYVSLLHASTVAHMQDRFSEFHSVTACTRRQLWSLPTVAPWVEFKIHYHDFLMTGALGKDINSSHRDHGLVFLYSRLGRRSLNRGGSLLRLRATFSATIRTFLTLPTCTCTGTTTYTRCLSCPLAQTLRDSMTGSRY